MAATKGQQVVNGLRLTGIGFGAALVLLGLFDGFRRIASSTRPLQISADVLVGLAELLLGGTILFVTTNLWAKWVIPVAILGALKSLIGLIAGTTVALPIRPVPRIVMGETLAYFLAVGVLSIRFSSHAPRMTERIALVIVVLGLCAAMLFEPQPLFLALSAGSLVVARVASTMLP
jgi:hypothetical protein